MAATLNRERDRAEVLAALEFVDYVVALDEDTPHRLIRSIMPKVLVKGGDYTVDEIVGREFAGKTFVLPFVEGYSTTNIIKNLWRNVSKSPQRISKYMRLLFSCWWFRNQIKRRDKSILSKFHGKIEFQFSKIEYP